MNTQAAALRRLRLTCIIVAATLALPPNRCAAGDLGSVAADLRRAKTEAELDAVANGVSKERAAMVTRLGGLLKNGAAKALKVRACFLLGQFHGTEALDQLVDNIDLEAESPRPSAWGKYPCEEAVAKLGVGIQPSLLERLAKTEAAAPREQLVRVLVSLHGAPEATEVLRQAMVEQGGERAARLAAALSLIEGHR